MGEEDCTRVPDAAPEEIEVAEEGCVGGGFVEGAWEGNLGILQNEMVIITHRGGGMYVRRG